MHRVSSEFAPAPTENGEPISPVPPFGAAIVVYRRIGSEMEFLVLHRGHHGAAYEGDWAWGPPSGSRYPDEQPDDCAKRELLEETGLRLELRPVRASLLTWHVYLAEATGVTDLRLSPEHDRYAWLPLDHAASRVARDEVRAQLFMAARLIAALQGEAVVHSQADIMSGTPVFVGTRVPVDNLIDHLQGGDSLDEFLEQFPSVRREQAIAALEFAREALWAQTGRAPRVR